MGGEGNGVEDVPPMDKPTSVKLMGQCPPGVDWSQRNETGLHCRNRSAVVMVLKMAVLATTLQSRTMCQRRRTIRRRKRAMEAFDAAIPI